MKKTIKFIAIAIISAITLFSVFFAISPIKRTTFVSGECSASYENAAKPKKRKPELPEGINNVISVKPFFIKDGERAAAVLTGEGELYKQNVKIYVCQGNKILYEIKAEDGYSPEINFFRFEKEKPFLFYSSQTGGSGGYGNYTVYDLGKTDYKILYDANKDDAGFTAEFVSGGRMKLTDGADGNELIADVSYMDKDFYLQIFDKNGEPKGEAANVNGVSAAFPYYNGATGLFGLITYRSVTAVAEVNNLGYITQNLAWDGKAFSPVFTNFAISI